MLADAAKHAFDALIVWKTDRIGRNKEEIALNKYHLKKNGVKIGLPKGTTLETKKSLYCKAIIQKHSKDFGGTLDDPDVIKLCGCSRNSYYKYKRELKHHT